MQRAWQLYHARCLPIGNQSHAPAALWFIVPESCKKTEDIGHWKPNIYLKKTRANFF